MGKTLLFMMNEGSGEIVNDSSGHGNNGLMVDCVWSQAVNGRWCIAFDDGQIQVLNDSSIQMGSVGSFSLWFSRASIGSSHCLFDNMLHSGYPTPGGVFIVLQADNTLMAVISNGTNHFYVFGTTPITDINMHRVTLAIGSGVARLYLDGALEGHANISGSWPATHDLFIGKSTTAGDAFNGRIATFQIYDVALTDYEEAAEFVAEVEQFAGLQLPGVVEGVQVINLRPDSLSLTWEHRPIVEGVTAYKVYRNGSLLNTINDNTIYVPGLTPEQTYQFRVSAVNASGEGQQSEIVQVTTPAEGAGTQVVIYSMSPMKEDPLGIGRLPTHLDAIPDSFISDYLFFRGAPGTKIPATFFVKALTSDVANLVVSPTTIGPISTSDIDIKVVGCWIQSPDKFFPAADRLMPELLMNDPDLIRCEDGKNYVKMTDGSFRLSGDPNNSLEVVWPNQYLTLDEFPVQDAPSLLPVNIPWNQNRQFWVTINIPEGTAPGTYSGELNLITGGQVIATIQIDLQVVPITLEPYLGINNVYYDGYYDPAVDGGKWANGSIGRKHKSISQLTAELQDMFDHGINYPQLAQPWNDMSIFASVLDIMVSIGFPTDKIFLLGKENNLGHTELPYTAQVLQEIQQEVMQVVSICQAHGFQDVYFYGMDESAADIVNQELPAWQAIQAGGGKVYVAGRNSYFTDTAKAILNCLNDSTESGWPAIAQQWHNFGNMVCQYSNPQCGLENPAIYRRYVGLQIWQSGLDGLMNWSYQGHYGLAWNEFSWGFGAPDIHGYIMAYPTMNGVVDTIQWEGWREGVYDMRYVVTLEKAIAQAKAAGQDVSGGEAFLAQLSGMNMVSADLDAVRNNLIDQILNVGVPVKGSLEIYSNPAGAQITLNGVSGGVTPATLVDLFPGPYTVVLELPGYYVESRNINITAGQTATIDVTFTPEDEPPTKGLLTIVTNPSNAVCKLSGTVIGNSPLSLDIDPGTYMLEISLSGYQTLRIQNLLIQAGFVTTIDQVLTPVSGPAAMAVGIMVASIPLLMMAANRKK
jgi:hypothetical protein